MNCHHPSVHQHLYQLKSTDYSLNPETLTHLTLSQHEQCQ
ncbi:taurine catabolism dioxygenase TauD, TfdA family protein [Aspergillus luchuensis]|uniref:Taurine catabolism dioxygenase TauD, TfdA family protein n=1 Tax=Aspergillus kawachii TaxID=1069201 RepID=A0A146F2S0_ASPKA|nr:taurine catabolism dioxygenase TauD, TfdA family protein [Aspergillus luchuensis]